MTFRPCFLLAIVIIGVSRTYSSFSVKDGFLDHSVVGGVIVGDDEALVFDRDCKGRGKEDESAGGKLHFVVVV